MTSVVHLIVCMMLLWSSSEVGSCLGGSAYSSQRSFDVLISREGKKEQRHSEPRRDWGFARR